ncbi:putative peptide zinc metalloprotease protein [Azospirillaceae bacterium]
MCSASALLSAINAETTLEVEESDLIEFIRFLRANALTRSDSPLAVQAFVEQVHRSKLSWPMWLLHHYLFVRIPLARPDAFLSATLPFARILARPSVLSFILLLGVVGVGLSLRQWDIFLHTFQNFMSWDGAAAFAITLSIVKIAHELGHAYVAHAFGCRTPTMGVALLVLWPVLYTDVSDAWRLTSRRQRLLIDAAGVLTELSLAMIATFLWSFLPDGPLRSAAFLVSTTTWVSTVAINLSPFMRFDGYYLLTDALAVSNLQDRAFALGRWRLRRLALGVDDPPPEFLPSGIRRKLIVYAWATWLYRAIVFFGVAFMVYHFFIKIVGILLMAVEIGWFLVRPAVSEARQWWRLRHRLRLNRALATTVTLLTGGGLLLITPWQTTISAPAVLRAADYATLFSPGPARIAEIVAQQGQSVQKGDLLIRLEAPEIDYNLRITRLKIAAIEIRLQRQAIGSPEVLDSIATTQQQLATLISTETGLRARQEKLLIRAPLSGEVIDLPPELHSGLWVKPDQALGRVINRARATLRGYLDAADHDRIQSGASGRFIPEDPTRPTLDVIVNSIERINAATLDVPALASTQGGPIPVQPTPGASNATLIPVQAIYRAALSPVDSTFPTPEQTTFGVIRINAEAASPISRAWKFAIGVLIRESGF